MAHILPRLLQAYKRHGFEIRGGVNPYYFNDPDSAFMLICKNGLQLRTGGGLAPMEILILEQILSSLSDVKNILIIGNAFGWSTLAIAMASPGAKVVAIDADIEGSDAGKGGELTEAIAREEGLNIIVAKALSPRDIPSVIHQYMNDEPLDFVLIDGLHVNEQLLLDFQAVSKHASERCIFALHDILNWHMLSALEKISENSGYTASILTRSPSGMGIVYKAPPSLTTEIINSYVDETINLLAWIKSKGGNLHEPGPDLQNRLSVGYPSRLIGLAGVAVAEGNWGKASEILARAIRAEPHNVNLIFDVGAFFFDQKKWRDADTCLAEAQKLAPDWAHPPHLRGIALRQLSRLDEAISCSRLASELGRTWAPPYFELGKAQFEKNDRDAALMSFKRACELDISMAFNIGAFLIDNAAFVEAEPFFQQTATHTPNCFEPFHQLGRIKRHLKRFDEAIVCFRHAAELAPTSFAPYAEMGFIEIENGNLEAALELFTHAATLNDREPFIWKSLTTLRLDLGHYREALECLQAAQAQAPSQVFPWEDLATYLPAGSGGEKIIQMLELLCMTEPKWKGVRKALGMALRKVGRFQDSRRILESALELLPEWPGVLYELGLTCTQSGEPEAAKKYLLRALELRPSFVEASTALKELSVT